MGHAYVIKTHAGLDTLVNYNVISLCLYYVHNIGGVITNLTAVQATLNTVRVTWTAPPGPPAMYQIMVDAPESDFNVNATESPYSLNTSELGMYSIQVLYNSQHFTNEQAMAVEVTVRGEGECYHNND